MKTTALKELICFKALLLFVIGGFLSVVTQAERSRNIAEFPSGPVPILNVGKHLCGITDCAFVDGGKTLVTVAEDRTVRTWDARTLAPGKLIIANTQTMARINHSRYFAVAAHPDNPSLIAAAGNIGTTEAGFRLIDVNKIEQLQYGEGSSRVIQSIAFSPDGRWLVYGNMRGDLELREIADGSYLPRDVVKLEGFIRKIEFSSEGHRFVCSQNNNRNVDLFDIDTQAGRLKKVLRYSLSGSVSLAPNGKVAIGKDQTDQLVLFDPDTGFLKHRLPSVISDEKLTNAIFSSDSRKVYLPMNGAIQVVDLESMEVRSVYNRFLSSSIYGMARGENGLMALVGSNPSSIVVWDSKTDQVLATQSGTANVHGLALRQSKPLCVAWGHQGRNYYDNQAPLAKGFDFSRLELIDTGDISEHEYERSITDFQGERLRRSGWSNLYAGSHHFTSNQSSIVAHSWTDRGSVAISAWKVLSHYRPEGSGPSGLPQTKKMMGVLSPSGPSWCVTGHRSLPVIASGGADGVVQFWTSEKGQLLANLFVDADDEWVCWTPLGFYAASENGAKYLEWYSDFGPERLSKRFDTGQARSEFYQPELIRQIFSQFQTDRELLSRLDLAIPELSGATATMHLPFELEGKSLPRR